MSPPDRMTRKDNRTPAVSARARRARTQTSGLLRSVLLFTCLCLSGCAYDRSGTDAGPGSLDSRLRDLAFSRMDRQRPLTPPARQALLEFIDHGVRRLRSDGATPERIAAAETNLGRFMSVLNEESSRLTLHEIDLTTLSSTRKALCPLYPYC